MINKNKIITAFSLVLLYILTFSMLRYNFNWFLLISNPSWGIVTTIIIALVISLFIFCFYLIIFTSKIDSLKIFRALFNEEAFLIYMIIVGVTISVLIPIGETPDELNHIKMIYEDLGSIEKWSNNPLLHSITQNAWEYNIQEGNSNFKIDIYKYFCESANMPNINSSLIPSILILRHFPQAIGILIGVTFHLPIIFCFTLSEILAVIFYSLICYYSLKILPTKKLLFACTMTLPICIQQMGAFSYDAVQIPLCFLFVSKILQYKFTKKEVNEKHFLFLLLIITYIGIIKVPYVLLSLLILIIPKKKIKIKFYERYIRSSKYKTIFIFTIIFILCLAILCTLLLLKQNQNVKIAIASIVNLSGTIELLDKTIYQKIYDYLTSFTGNFGWLDTPSPRLFNKIVLVLFITFSMIPTQKDNNNFRFSSYDKLIVLATSLLLVASIIISMISWELSMILNIDISNYSISNYAQAISWVPLVEGPQGRYFIIILPLVFMIWQFKKPALYLKNHINYKFTFEFYLLTIYLYMILRMLTRYWLA